MKKMKKMKKIILFPSNPLNFKEVDHDFLSEFNVCKTIGLNYILFDFDLFIRENKSKRIGKYTLKKKSNKKTWAYCVYRGWMLKIKHYAELWTILISNGISLINSPSQYEMVHYFPKAYPLIKKQTPITKWIKKETLESGNVDYVKSVIKTKIADFKNKFIIKDFAKSLKLKNNSIQVYSKYQNTDYLYSKIISFIADRKTFGNFYGGIVFKEFVNLKQYMAISNEWRMFVLDGSIISCEQNTNLHSVISQPQIKHFERAAKKLPVSFFTMDVAELINGDWIIIEVGDAQVSGLATNQNPIGLFNNLKANLQ